MLVRLNTTGTACCVLVDCCSEPCCKLQAAELEQQSDIASAGTMHNFAGSAMQDMVKSISLGRQSTRAQKSFMQSTEPPQGDTHGVSGHAWLSGTSGLLHSVEDITQTA